MFKAFLKIYWSRLLLVGEPLGIFALIFYLIDGNWAYYRLGAELSLFLVGIYLAFSFLFFKKQRSLQDQLKESQDQLKQLTYQSKKNYQEMEDYFITWVHQIKTPLTACDLLLNSEQENRITLLRQELIMIENYTNMAMSYLKLKNPSAQLTITKVPLDQLLAPLLKKYRLFFIDKSIHLHYQPILDEVVTDNQWTSLMIEQVLNNALKYTSKGDIWIDYHIQSEKIGLLRIQDSGIGILDADLPKIFYKGFSGYNGTMNQRSSELGLFLVKQIEGYLNQPVHVSSSLGKGTCFTIELHRQIHFE